MLNGIPSVKHNDITIVEKGVEDDWNYTKYSDGTFDAWKDHNYGTKTVGSLALNTGETSNLYRSSAFAKATLPTALGFNTLSCTSEIVSFTAATVAWLWIINYPNKTINIVSSIAASATDKTVKNLVIHHEAHGTWS